MITIQRTNSNSSDFRLLIQQLDKDLAKRYGTLQQVYDQYNKIENLDTIVIAFLDNEPVGCGCFKYFDKNMVEVKRMYVKPEVRGKGAGSRILTELENWAGELKYKGIVLELGNKQPEATRLYKKQGYEVIPNYGQYIGMENSICMKKDLTW